MNFKLVLFFLAGIIAADAGHDTGYRKGVQELLTVAKADSYSQFCTVLGDYQASGIIPD
ncbi:hypothetical protein [Kiloniella sp.]|uniref:hypothetical protein n=1 Tax=Kiloniella sp. TaxID=1938587 RepID=UPI003B01D254